MEDLMCPHCHTDVPRGAFVCTGCQAQVTYGYSGKEYLTLFIVAGFAMILIGSFMEILAMPVFIGILILGFWTMSKKGRDRVMFRR